MHKGRAFARGKCICTRGAFALRVCAHKGKFAQGTCICTRNGHSHEGSFCTKGMCAQGKSICTRGVRLHKGIVFAQGNCVCTRELRLHAGCFCIKGACAQGKGISIGEACLCKRRTPAPGVCLPREVYLPAEVKQGSALVHPSDVRVQRAPWHMGWVLGAGMRALVSTGPALTHHLMDAGWHGMARHGMARHGTAQRAPGRGPPRVQGGGGGTGAPQGCGWLCGVTLCPPAMGLSTGWELGVQLMGHPIPAVRHPGELEAPMGAQHPRGSGLGCRMTV